jgi:hypothetical protein
MAQVREAIPRWYALVDLQGVVPRLGDSRQVERVKPDAVSRRHLLSVEELFATAQPVQLIGGTVIGGELHLAEAQNAQPLECVAAGATERGLLVGAVGVGGTPCGTTYPAVGHRWVRPVGEEWWMRWRVGKRDLCDRLQRRCPLGNRRRRRGSRWDAAIAQQPEWTPLRYGDGGGRGGHLERLDAGA